MEGIRQRLLVNILKTADYYVDLIKLYSYRKPSSEVKKEDERNVIDDLTKLMRTKKARKIKESESRVYSTQPKKETRPNMLEKVLQTKIQQLEQQQQQLVLKLKGQTGAAKGPPKAHKNVGINVPASPFKHPCYKCESKPGTDKEKKDLCTSSHHCRIHDGEWMCTKSQACRLRTEKVKTLMKFKETQIPPKASRVTINQIMQYTDEDLEQITTDQPCIRGDPCL